MQNKENIRASHFRKSEMPWLNAGLEMLAYGPHINVDTISKKIGVSRTSFYHLFGNKSGFVERIGEYWEYSGTHWKLEYSCNKSY